MPLTQQQVLGQGGCSGGLAPTPEARPKDDTLPAILSQSAAHSCSGVSCEEGTGVGPCSSQLGDTVKSLGRGHAVLGSGLAYLLYDLRHVTEGSWGIS